MVDRIGGYDLEEKAKLFLGVKEGRFHTPLEHIFIHLCHFLPSQIALLGVFKTWLAGLKIKTYKNEEKIKVLPGHVLNFCSSFHFFNYYFLAANVTPYLFIFVSNFIQ